MPYNQMNYNIKRHVDIALLINCALRAQKVDTVVVNAGLPTVMGPGSKNGLSGSDSCLCYSLAVRSFIHCRCLSVPAR
jgi:hypothetical protein